MSSSREQILGRIRSVLGGISAQPAALEESFSKEYRYTGTLSAHDRVELFVDRLRDYDALVHRVSAPDIPMAVARALSGRGKKGLLVPLGIPTDWLPTGYLFERDTGLRYEEIDGSEGVLTGCAAGIALTGTIVLRHSESEGRRALTLIPDYHLCVVHEHQIVETVPEGFQKIRQYAQSPITTISGPSATSDIEMTRIKGVHGPRTLEVIVVA